MSRHRRPQMWTHVYFNDELNVDWGAAYVTMWVESTEHPEALVAAGRVEIKTENFGTVRYVRSYDHDPTEAERELLMRSLGVED